MSDEGFKFQVSFKTPTQTLINLRGDDEEEINLALDALGRQLKTVGEIEEMLGAMQNIYAGMSPAEKVAADSEAAANAPARPSQGATNQAPAQSPGGGGADGHMCRHGQMVYKESKPDAPKKWRAYMCPSSNRADQCDPQWLRG